MTPGMAWVEIMLPSARTLPTGKLTQNPIRTGERRCILYVGNDSGINTGVGSRDPSLDDRPAREIEDLRERAERAERERDQAQREHDRLQRENDRLRQQMSTSWSRQRIGALTGTSILASTCGSTRGDWWSYIQRSGRVDVDRLALVSPRFVAQYEARIK